MATVLWRVVVSVCRHQGASHERQEKQVRCTREGQADHGRGARRERQPERRSKKNAGIISCRPRIWGTGGYVATGAAAAVAATLVFAAAPAAAQEEPGPNGVYDLRQAADPLGPKAPPPDDVVKNVSDPERYAELSAELSELERKYDETLAAKEAARNEIAGLDYSDADNFEANDAIESAARQREAEAEELQDIVQTQARPAANEMTELEEESEEELEAEAERQRAEGPNDEARDADDATPEPGAEDASASEDGVDEEPAAGDEGGGFLNTLLQVLGVVALLLVIVALLLVVLRYARKA